MKIIALGRNSIKGFSGLEPLGDTLQELWISYNLIEKMKGINAMRNLRVLYMSNNLVREWNEFNRLQELPNLQDLVFVGNPLYESLEVRFEILQSAFNPILPILNPKANRGIRFLFATPSGQSLRFHRNSSNCKYT